MEGKKLKEIISKAKEMEGELKESWVSQTRSGEAKEPKEMEEGEPKGEILMDLKEILIKLWEYRRRRTKGVPIKSKKIRSQPKEIEGERKESIGKSKEIRNQPKEMEGEPKEIISKSKEIGSPNNLYHF